MTLPYNGFYDKLQFDIESRKSGGTDFRQAVMPYALWR